VAVVAFSLHCVTWWFVGASDHTARSQAVSRIANDEQEMKQNGPCTGTTPVATVYRLGDSKQK